MPAWLTDWLQALSPWAIVLALVAIVLGWVLARVARRGATALLARVRGISPGMANLAVRVLYIAVLLLGVGIALSFLGAPIQPVLAAAILIGVVAFLALRGISENFAAGVVLQTRRPIELGHLISSDGHTGTVIDMNGRSVVLRTVDGLEVHVPNANVLKQPLINYSSNRANRCEVEVRLEATDQDHSLLRQAVIDDAGSATGWLAEPAARVLTILDEPRRVILRLQFWADPADTVSTTSRVVEAIADGCLKRGVTTVVTSQLPMAPLTRPADL